MKKIKLIIAITLNAIFFVQAQVKDISLTMSPAYEYSFWDSKSGLKDGTLIGGKLGFGFGEYIELRGVYMQSLGLKTSFKDYGIRAFDSNIFTEQDINLSRWGGEFKANIGTKGIKPYFIFGTGVQKVEIDINKKAFEQIYGSLGVGFKINLDKRIVLGFEATNTTYNFNSAENLLADVDKINFGVSNVDFTTERLTNWSALGTVEFYLGGRRPGKLTELDEAYLNKFKGGFKGLQLIIEPSVAYITFDNNSLFKDTYLLGGYAGIDISEYIGIRGFYLQATKNEEISTNFDDLAMYGAEVRARLNDGNGVVPFLILGGGYLNANNSYLGKENSTVSSSEFAHAGLGLNIPLGRNFLITGGAKAMFTSGDDIQNISAPNTIQTHMLYNAGLKIVFGKKSESAEKVYQNKLQSELSLQQEENNLKIKNLKDNYQSTISKLESEIERANTEQDVSKAVELLEEKKEVNEALKEVKNIEKLNNKALTKSIDSLKPNKQDILIPNNQILEDKNSTMIKMTPIEFESLLKNILTKLVPNENLNQQSFNKDSIETNYQLQIELLNNRLNNLEKLMLEKSSVNNIEDETKKNTLKTIKSTNDDKELLKYQDNILKKLKDLNEEIENKSNTLKINNSELLYQAKDTSSYVANIDSISANQKLFNYQYISTNVGLNVGSKSYINFGINGHYLIKNTQFEFIPEIFIGIGNQTVYGATANIVHPFFKNNKTIKPYAGIGLGVLNDNNFKGIYAVKIGSKLPTLNKNMYVEYTMRNNFDYNLFSIGYKLPF